MPSTFTEQIENDPDFTFAEFAWFCTRGLMVSILLRDEATRIPTTADLETAIGQRGVDDCREEVEKARRELNNAETFSMEGWEAEARSEYRLRLADWVESSAVAAVVSGRYDAMKVQVEAWDPPTPEHESLKKYMLEQIQESTKYDHEQTKPVMQTPMERRASSIELLRRRLDSELKRLANATENATFRERWFLALRASIPLPDARPRSAR